MPRHLDEVLRAGPEAWSLCATVLTHIAHDHAAAAAGADGRTLPLLADTGGGMGGSSRAVALVPEGPLPLAGGVKLRPPGSTLGQMQSSPGSTAQPQKGSIAKAIAMAISQILCEPVFVIKFDLGICKYIYPICLVALAWERR